MSWKGRLHNLAQRIQPLTRTVERIAQVAIHLQKPTTLGVMAAAAAGINALSDNAMNGPSSRRLALFCTVEEAVEALRGVGVTCQCEIHPNGKRTWWFAGDQAGTIDTDGWLFFHGVHGPGTEAQEWLRGVLDNALPQAYEIRRRPEVNGETGGYDGTAVALTQVAAGQADAIWRSTAGLLVDGPRCILLTGKPGVGKTTAAQAIARDARIGRTVLLGNESLDDDDWSSGDFGDALELLSPGVIVIDDVDKVKANLARLERIRAATRLLILTANNGDHDEVLDGALMRAGRVDEVFTLLAEPWERRAPFDLLSDEDWAEISQWPAAYFKEVERRLAHRPDDLRLDDIRARILRRTRSGSVMA